MSTNKPKQQTSVEHSEGHRLSPRSGEERSPLVDEDEPVNDRDFGWEEGDPADRRRDPLRR